MPEPMAALESATPNVGKENAAAGVGKAAEEPAPNDPKPDDKAPATRPPEKGLKWAVIMEVRKGNADFLNEYLDGGADVDLKEVSPAGRPLLCWAALGNQFECLKILVDRGADVDIKDCSGTTALNYVCRIFPPDKFQQFCVKGEWKGKSAAGRHKLILDREDEEGGDKKNGKVRMNPFP